VQLAPDAGPEDIASNIMMALASPEPLIAAWARYRLRVMAAHARGAADPFDQYFAGANVLSVLAI
jgi:hypothetical protein